MSHDNVREPPPLTSGAQQKGLVQHLLSNTSTCKLGAFRRLVHTAVVYVGGMSKRVNDRSDRLEVFVKGNAEVGATLMQAPCE